MRDDRLTAAVPPPPAPEPPAAPPWTWRDVGGVVLLIVVAAAALALLARGLVAALGLTLEQRLISPAVYVVGLGIYLAAIGGVYAVVGRRAGRAALGLRRPDWWSLLMVPPLFVAGMLALVLINATVGLLMGGFENPQVEALTGGAALAPVEVLLLLILVAGVVPFAEELFFRGMLYPLMRRDLGPAFAILLNAALFALVHVIPQLLPGLFIIGLILAYLRERSGSIWPGVLYHALQNGLALLLINVALAG
ncbi:MAG: type II CAAX endopeptidase family protein [Chloroflexaceae bacterium]